MEVIKSPLILILPKMVSKLKLLILMYLEAPEELPLVPITPVTLYSKTLDLLWFPPETTKTLFYKLYKTNLYLF